MVVMFGGRVFNGPECYEILVCWRLNFDVIKLCLISIQYDLFDPSVRLLDLFCFKSKVNWG